jgi:hypothetical protein
MDASDGQCAYYRYMQREGAEYNSAPQPSLGWYMQREGAEYNSAPQPSLGFLKGRIMIFPYNLYLITFRFILS